ncbi:MAG: MATE family efflux transporter [Oscillospiraceae bacterium]|nr:MATE family efflux transporter [Oscillospiraceae bacterium]
MTRGSLWRGIAAFSAPVILGNILQQLYGAADAVIVGNFVGGGALAAVGMSLPMTVVALGFLSGMSSGAGAVAARAFGAGDCYAMRKAVHTAAALAVALGAVVSAGGWFLTAPLLRLMRTPGDIFGDALAYFRVYFAGMLATSAYNMGAAILGAFGETRKPVVFLAASSAVNIVLDLLFVLVFHMGVVGAALATLIAQVVSAALMFRELARGNLPVKLRLREMRFDAEKLRQIVRIGLPVGVERLTNGATNIMLQAYINGLGSVYAAGWGVTNRVDAFVYMLTGAFASSVVACVGQNVGAGQTARARRGVRVTLALSCAAAIAVSAVLLALNTRVLRMFTPDAEVLGAAFAFMRVLTATYWLDSIVLILSDALAGTGRALRATVINTVTHVGIRQAYLFAISRVWYTPTAVALCYPLAWATAIPALFVAYRRIDWRKFEKPALE